MKKLFFGLLTILLTNFVSAAPQIKNPIVYGISPLYLSYGHSIEGFEAIRRRLPEIVELGANIVWLQPITPPFEEDGHGYDVIEYKKVWSKLGSDESFKRLVKESHAKGLKLMLDVVLNHSSLEHPFVKDIAVKGKASPYYGFYQHNKVTNVPYADFQNEKQIGQGNFIYYFWPHLLNFDYQNKELRAYMLDVLSYWVKEFDVDGFRFDASWGPSSRYANFYQEISQHLRAIKPSIILMAEDMTGYPKKYRNSNHPHLKNSGFDWAYDWNNQDPYWISKWTFQTGDEQSETLFNNKDSKANAEAFLKMAKYSENQAGIAPVRYIENNDTPGFLLNHSIEESKFAAKIMFLLPGVPLIFYGQETGNRHELFELPSFDPNRKMSSIRPELWAFYKSIISHRKNSRALTEGTMTDLKLESPGIATFNRIHSSETLKIKIDFNSKKVFINTKEF